MPRSLVYPTLLSALRLQGFTAIEGDGVVKIVPEADAKQQAGAIATGPITGGGDRLVTQVIILKYESAAQLVNVLRPLITPNNTIAAYPNGNALVITDYADNLKRLDRIIASLDQPPGGEPVLVPLRYASAIDIVPLINKLVADTIAAGAPGTPADVQQRVTVIADPRSNSILLRADNPGRVAHAAADRAARHARPPGRQHVHRLSAERGRRARRADAPLDADRQLRRGIGHERDWPFAAAAVGDARQHARSRRNAGAAGSRAGAIHVVQRDVVRGRRRDDHGRRCQQRARDHGARAGLQQSPRDHRKARCAARAGLCRGIDLRGLDRQVGRVRHPVAGALRHQVRRKPA